LDLVAQGYRVRYEPHAHSYELASLHIRDDFHVKVRMVAGGFQTLAENKVALMPLRSWFAFGFFSHKTLRWLAPVFLVFLLLFSLPLYVILALVIVAYRARRAPRGSGLHQRRHVFLLLAAFVYVASVPATDSAVSGWLEGRYPARIATAAQRSDDNVIIVLTAGWLRGTRTGWEQKIGEAGWERTAAAVMLWRRIGGRLLFRGAPTPDGAR